jgi:hypothetical protein
VASQTGTLLLRNGGASGPVLIEIDIPSNSNPNSAPAYSLDDIRAVLFSSVLSDCLDQCGVTKQAMPSRIRPLDLAAVMVGRARTAAFMEVYHVAEGVNPYELEIALIDSLQPGEIPVFACSNPGRVAPWVAWDRVHSPVGPCAGSRHCCALQAAYCVWVTLGVWSESLQCLPLTPAASFCACAECVSVCSMLLF